MIGNVSWAGTFNTYPAVLCGYYGGATLWCYILGDWKLIKKFSGSNNGLKYIKREALL